MRKTVAAAALAASITAGGIGGALIGVPSLAGAQTSSTTAAADDCPAHGPGGPGGRHGRGPGLDAAAEALGMTDADLRTELQSGKSIADVAGEKSVDVQAVIDAMVADAKEHLAQAVTDGRITQDQADERLADLEDHITARVNGEAPAGPPADAPQA